MLLRPLSAPKPSHHRSAPSGPRAARALTGISLAVFLLAWPGTAAAQKWDAFPKLGKGRVSAVGAGIDRGPLDGLESCLQGVESAVGADYFAAIVEVSDPEGRATPDFGDAVPYVDALYRSWRSSRRLDPEEHILVLVALSNRAVAIHPGSRWADLGFEAGEITRVIDGSRFGDYARGGDFDRAICALAEHVDHRLQQLVNAEQERVAALGGEIDRAQGWLAKVAESVTPFARDLPVQASAIMDSVKEAADSLSLARRSLERDRQGDARTHLVAGRQLLDSIDRRLKRDRGIKKALADRLGELDQLSARLEKTGRAPDPLYVEPLKALDACRGVITGAQAEQLGGKVVDHGVGEGCLGKVQKRVSEADVSYVMKRQLIPLVVCGGLVLAVLLVFFYLLGRRVSAEKKAREDIERWRSKLAFAADHLLELERHHPLYFSPEGRRWSGDSRPLDQACADAVNRVYVLYGQATQLLDEAERLVESGGWLRAGPYLAAYKLLRETEITFDVGSPEPAKDHRRIFLPMTEDYKGTALELLDDLDSSYTAARDRLDELAALEARHQALEQQVGAAAERALAAGRTRAELGLPTGDAMAEIDPLLAERKRVALDLMSDPVQAVARLEGLLGQLEGWADRLHSGNETITELRGTVTETGASIRARLGALRADGFRLEEPGFQPDLRLDRGVGQAEDIERAVAGGRETEAREQLEALFYGLVELEQQLGAIAAARDGIPEHLSQLDGEIEELGRRIPAARRTLGELRRDHAADAYEVEADNLAELEHVLGELDGWRTHIREDHQRQHYLSALEDLETARRLVADGRALLTELREIRAALDASRARCQSSARSLAEALERLADGTRQPGVSRHGLDEAAAIDKEARGLLAETEQDRPHWPRLEDAIEGALEATARITETLEAQHERYVEAMAQAETIDARLRELDRKVRADDRDRPHVAQAVADADRALATWRRGLESGLEESEAPPSGDLLLDQVRELGETVAWAEGIWRSELEVIHLAESELAAADAVCRREDGRHHGHGVVADCSDARHELRAAREARDRREWEKVLEQARRASEAAEREARRCRREADEREEEERRRLAAQRAAEAAERRRRERARREAERAAAAAASASSWRSAQKSSWSSSHTSSSSFGRSAPSSPSRSSSPSKASASTSRFSSKSSSSSSSSSWGSRSGASSFHGGGKSRSGGSRW